MTSLTWDRYQGHAWSYDVIELGYNYRIDEIRSALGVAQLKKLRNNNTIRRKLTDAYWRAMEEEIPQVELPFRRHRGESACHLMAVMLPEGTNRTLIMERMKERGIQTSIHYPPIHLFSYYQRYGAGLSLDSTEDAAKRVLTLPLFARMEVGDVKEVVIALREALD
jgi:dTDP-4-amino-4,6-dideoxygalactose transaminase